MCQRAPGPLRMTEMKGRGQQPGRNQDIAEGITGEGQPKMRREQAADGRGDKKGEQAIAGARCGREKYNGFRWMHCCLTHAERNLSTQRAITPAELSETGISSGAVCPSPPCFFGRGGRYLLVGRHSCSGIRS